MFPHGNILHVFIIFHTKHFKIAVFALKHNEHNMLERNINLYMQKKSHFRGS